MRDIVFISRNISAAGGIQGQIFNIAKSLYERKIFQPVLITADRNCGFAMLFSKAGFEVFEAPMEKSKIFPAAQKILQILKDRDVAIIQTHIFRESLIARAVRRKRTNIRHILRAETYIDGVPKPCWKKRLYHLADKFTGKWVDFYIANGQYLADEIINRSKIDSNKVAAILNGVNQLGPPDKPVEIKNKPLPPKIAMIANFRAVKGHDCLVRALALLKQINLIITARLIGSEGQGNAADEKDRNITEETKKLASSLGVLQQFEFYGCSDNVYKALEGIPVVVLPANSSEGMPNCLLEAMSARKLVIASKMNGVGEIIDDKKTGLLCRPQDPKGLANLLQYVFTSKAGDFEQMRTAGLEKWKKEFTGEKMVDKLVEIYYRLGVL